MGGTKAHAREAAVGRPHAERGGGDPDLHVEFDVFQSNSESPPGPPWHGDLGGHGHTAECGAATFKHVPHTGGRTRNTGALWLTEKWDRPIEKANVEQLKVRREAQSP